MARTLVLTSRTHVYHWTVSAIPVHGATEHGKLSMNALPAHSSRLMFTAVFLERWDIRGLPDLHLSRRIVSAQLREIARRRRVVGLAARSPRPRLRFSHHAHRHLRLAILIMGALFLTAPSVPSGPRIYTPTRGTTTVHGATLLTIIDNLPLFQQRRLRTAAVSISLSLPRTPAVPPEPSFRVRSARSGSDEGSPCPAPPHELLAHAASGPRM
ncbi:hypothetical protein DFH09DRAFT_1318010 [Mycena vulgaris]|nr:hypothetical protein DFH09DRAFT_1318010 [Mycena vulgaris]